MMDIVLCGAETAVLISVVSSLTQGITYTNLLIFYISLVGINVCEIFALMVLESFFLTFWFISCQLVIIVLSLVFFIVMYRKEVEEERKEEEEKKRQEAAEDVRHRRRAWLHLDRALKSSPPLRLCRKRTWLPSRRPARSDEPLAVLPESWFVARTDFCFFPQYSDSAIEAGCSGGGRSCAHHGGLC
jgi:uncharacterized membrane protein